MSRQLISSDEAVDAKHQHTRACSDCPWSRKALNGWLGGVPAESWIRAAHSDTVVDCHVLRGQQCAGIAIYRTNVCKSSQPPMLKLPKDSVTVFSSPMEFLDHHSRLPDRRSVPDAETVYANARTKP